MFLLARGAVLTGSTEIFILEVGLGRSMLCIVFSPEVDEFLVGSLTCEVKGFVGFVMQEDQVLLEASLDDHFLLFEQDHCLLFGLVESVGLGILFEVASLAVNPFEDMGICIEGRGVSGDSAGDYFIPGPFTLLVNAE